MTIDEMIEVMQAYRDGAKIELSLRKNSSWNPTEQPFWNWMDYEYRVKKEPVRVRLYRYTKNHPWRIVDERFDINPAAEVITVEQVDG